MKMIEYVKMIMKFLRSAGYVNVMIEVWKLMSRRK